MSRELRAQIESEQLHAAAKRGDLAEIERLLQSQFAVNHFDFLGMTPLHYAVRRGRLDAVNLLLRAGANVNAHDERLIGNTPLSDVAGECSYEMAKRLIDAGADPTIPGWMQLTAMARAAKRTDTDGAKVQRLLKDAAIRRRTR